MKWGTTSALFLPLTSVSPSPSLVLTTQCDQCLEGSVRRALSTSQNPIFAVVPGIVSSACCKSALVLMIYVFLAIPDPS